MGVQGLHTWLQARFLPGLTKIPADFSTTNLYVDMNGIIHQSSGYENDFKYIKPDEVFVNTVKSDKERLHDVGENLKTIVDICNPKDILYLAVDGVAPLAKLMEQRNRRLATKVLANVSTELETSLRNELESFDIMTPPEFEQNIFDKTKISVGTEFMTEVSEYLKEFVKNEQKNNPKWKNLKIIINDQTIPGEGEHKISDYLRSVSSTEAGNDSKMKLINDGTNKYSLESRCDHLVLSDDGDLSFICLQHQIPNIYVMKNEDQRMMNIARASTGSNMLYSKAKKSKHLDHALHEGTVTLAQVKSLEYELLNIDMMKLCLNYVFNELTTEHKPVNISRITNDIILLSNFLGNDFIPALPYVQMSIDFDKFIILYRNYVHSSYKDNFKIKHRAGSYKYELKETLRAIFKNESSFNALISKYPSLYSKSSEEDKENEEENDDKEKEQNYEFKYITDKEGNINLKNFTEFLQYFLAHKEQSHSPSPPPNAITSELLLKHMKNLKYNLRMKQKQQEEIAERRNHVKIRSAIASFFLYNEIKPSPEVEGFPLEVSIQPTTQPCLKFTGHKAYLLSAAEFGLRCKLQVYQEDINTVYIFPLKNVGVDKQKIAKELTKEFIVELNKRTDIYQPPAAALESKTSSKNKTKDKKEIIFESRVYTNEKALRADYYHDKFLTHLRGTKQINEGEDVKDIIVLEYLKIMQFVLKYYTKGIPNWNFSYPFLEAPFLEDISIFLQKHTKSPKSLQKLEETLKKVVEPAKVDSESLLPFTQLLMFKHDKQKDILPKALQSEASLNKDLEKIELDPNLLISNGGFRSYRFKLDLPHIKYEKLKEVDNIIRKLIKDNKLTESEIKRIAQGEIIEIENESNRKAIKKENFNLELDYINDLLRNEHKRLVLSSLGRNKIGKSKVKDEKPGPSKVQPFTTLSKRQFHSQVKSDFKTRPIRNLRSMNGSTLRRSNIGLSFLRRLIR